MSAKINSRQAGFIAFFILLGSAVTYMPESVAGRDAWISTLLAIPVGVGILALVIRVQNMFPGRHVLEISEMVLGRALGKLANILYLGLLFILAALYLYDLMILLHSVLLYANKYYLYGVLVLASAYGVYMGVNAVARLVELLMGLIMLFLLLAFFILIACCADFSRLTPVMADLRPILAGFLYTANWPFAQASLLLMYLPLVVDLATGAKVIYRWYLIAALILIIRSVLTVAVVGKELALLSRYPLFEAFRLMRMGDFERIELFFFVLIFVCSLLALLLFYQGLALGMQKLFRLQEYRAIILPLGLLLISLSTYMFQSDLEMMFIETLLPFIMLPIHLLFPLLLFIGGKIYLKRQDKSLSAR
ncbi:MAG: endospore germination permease [Syntrophomonadaceae bacterium]|jgi:spore germination protein KB|nr:endospore germination permease [Syntrophomonadaceae bacterium]